MNPLSLFVRRATVLTIRRAVTPVWRSPMAYRAMATVATKNFAVDAPDGSSDDWLDAEQHQVEDIIDHAAKFEDMDFVKDLHERQQDAARTFAVDAPDGEADDIHQEDLHAVEEVIDYAAEHEDKEQVLRAHELEEAVRKAMITRQGLSDF